MAKKVVKKKVAKRAVRKSEPASCSDCNGRGLLDSNTLCSACGGSGTI